MSDTRKVWGHSLRPREPLVIPWVDGFFLEVPAERAQGSAGAFPSSRIARGVILAHHGLDLCEEGVGFGVPVLVRKLGSVFPGSRRCRWVESEAIAEIELEYELNLAERLSRDGRWVGGPVARAAHEAAAWLHRAVPPARAALTALSSLLRRGLAIRTLFEEVPSQGTCTVRYRVEPRGAGCRLSVRVDAAGVSRAGLSEIVVMNELGARWFDCYEDSDGVRLAGGAIGTWNEVRAERAALRSSQAGVSFAVERRAGARLMRGRELVADRLSWAGFACRLAPGSPGLQYCIALERDGAGAGEGGRS